MAFWLIKSEPGDYGWDDLVRDGKTMWNGVRNFEARNNLRAMKRGDSLLFYHSGETRQIVGIASVAREAYPDPTARGEDWAAVDVAAERALARPVGLAAMRGDPALKGFALLRKTRLSVVPVAAAEWKRILALGGTRG
jgi:predicted RNA-binding protein with PUA-like domain